MDLIIGGAYQGKLDYAKNTFSVKDEDICVCVPDMEPDFTKKCFVHFENYVLRCLREDCEITSDLRPDAVIIADDIFCGVVPMDTEVRAWREDTGRVLTALSLKADTVTRLFCGLPLRLKG